MHLVIDQSVPHSKLFKFAKEALDEGEDECSHFEKILSKNNSHWKAFSGKDCKKLQALNGYNFYRYNNEIVTPAAEFSHLRLWVINHKRLKQLKSNKIKEGYYGFNVSKISEKLR